MNRTLKFAFGVVLGLGLVMPAAAQNFPDVPDNHWAYEALANLKGKVLFGYPDGLYRPARPMSRAEFAAAINQLYQLMMAKDNQLQAAIDALSRKIDGHLANHPNQGGTGGVPRAEFDALKRQVDEMQTRLNSMASWGQDIANLKRLATEFERELAAHGVDIDAMKRDIANLGERVTKLEQGGGGIQIHGDGNFVTIMGHSTDGLFGLSKAGRLLGWGRDDFDGVAVGMTQDLSVFHEFNTTLSGNSGENVSWKASLNFGNTLGWWDDVAFGDGNSQNAGWNIDSDNDASMWFDELSATFDTSLAGQGFTATAGRFRHSSGSFFLARPDYTEFYANDRWDNGEFSIDGAMINIGFGSVDLTVFGGIVGEGLEAVSGEAFELNSMFRDLGGDSFEVEQLLGFELGAKLGENANLRGVYLFQDSFNVDSGMNRMTTYGGEANFKVAGLDIYGAYAQTDFGYNTNVMLDDDNSAWAAWLAYASGERWGFDAGYARVEGNFGAFGSWGRLGTAYNPTNIEGFGGGLWFQLNDNIKLTAGAAFFNGAEDTSGLFGLPITTDDSVNSFHVGVDFGLSSAWDVKLGYENVKWDFDAGTDPDQRWYTVGLSHNLSDAAKFSIMYMMSDVDFKGRGALDPGGFDRYKGGALSSQLTFRF